jgi:hypothetical protein
VGREFGEAADKTQRGVVQRDRQIGAAEKNWGPRPGLELLFFGGNRRGVANDPLWRSGHLSAMCPDLAATFALLVPDRRE